MGSADLDWSRLKNGIRIATVQDLRSDRGESGRRVGEGLVGREILLTISMDSAMFDPL